MFVDAALALAGSITGNVVTGQALFASSATVISTNTADLGTARDIGEGEDLYGRVEITVAAVGGTSMEFQFIESAAANLSSPTVIGTTGPIPVASLVAGARFVCRIIPQLASLGQRYIGMQCVNVGANTAGSAYCDIGKEIQDFKTYASGFTVL